jgi:multimeric flavodoxin WrbA
MRVIAFNGSPRRGGNTARLVQRVFAELEKEGVGTELVELAGTNVHGCTACFQCFARRDRRCAKADDAVNGCIEKMIAADGIILASPTYFADITPEMKALMDRAGMVARANDNLFRRKVGAAVIAVRRGGAIHAFDSINHFFLIGEMIVPGSNYWNFAFGRQIGDVDGDEEGIRTMQTLGQNMAWLLKKLGT